MPDRSLPDRRKPAPGVNVPSIGTALVLVTVCAKDRHAWLACEEVHELLGDIWQTSTAWRAGRYVIMPDHIHLFAAFAGSHIQIDDWVKYWKSIFTKRHAHPEHAWQSRSYHHRLRSGESYQAKWEYVRNNPVRHGLVARPEDWPFQGSVFDLTWET